jgi:hypothetical protein
MRCASVCRPASRSQRYGGEAGFAALQGEMTPEGVKAQGGHWMLGKLLKQEVDAAGEFLIVGGAFVWFTNRSGTYRSEPASLLQVVDFFSEAQSGLRDNLRGAEFYAETSGGSVLNGALPE